MNSEPVTPSSIRSVGAAPQRPAQRPQIADRKGPFSSLRVIAALVLREMSSRYGRSAGGYLWAILEPVGAIAMISLAFAAVFRSPPLGTSFALFYATGVLPFTMYNGIGSRVATAISFSKALLNYPMVTFADALLARLIVMLITQILISYILITGILLLFDTRAVLDFRYIALSLALTSLLGFSVGTMNAYLFIRFRTWQSVWTILSRPMLLISGVLHLYSQLPDDLKAILWYNPVMHVVSFMRAGFYPTYDNSYASVSYVVGFSLVLLLLGLRFLNWSGKSILRDF